MPTEAKEEWYRTVREVLDPDVPGFATAFLGTARVYAVLSDTDPMEWYTVCVFETKDGELRSCTCRGYRYNTNCKHTERVP
jgi:hypothetical protein